MDCSRRRSAQRKSSSVDAAFRAQLESARQPAAAAGNRQATDKSWNGRRTTTSRNRAIATSRSCSRCIRELTSRCAARPSSRGRHARRSSAGSRMAADTPAGAAHGSSISGRGSRMAIRRTRTCGRSSRSRRCRTCGICTRRFKSTATSAARRASPRCCCKATPANTSPSGAAEGLGGWRIPRPARAWWRGGRSRLDGRPRNGGHAASDGRRRAPVATACRSADRKCESRWHRREVLHAGFGSGDNAAGGKGV